MNILKEVKEEFFYTTYNIDQLISKYLIKRLGVNDIETINALGLKGRMTFKTRLDLLMQIRSVSELNKQKLKIYASLYQALMLKTDIFNEINEKYFAFLIEHYPQDKTISSDKKIEKILIELVLDVQNIIEKISKVPTLQIINEENHSVDKVIHLSAI